MRYKGINSKYVFGGGQNGFLCHVIPWHGNPTMKAEKHVAKLLQNEV